MAPELVVHAVPPFAVPEEADRVRQDAEAILGGLELARARAMQPEARDRFLACRLEQRLFVAGLLAVRPERLAASYRCPACGSGPAVNHGRPGYLLDGVPAPVAFSASRAAGWTVLAAMVETVPGFRVGVDIEDPERTGFAGFTALALTPAEQRTVRHLSGSALLAERARLWARKEAWLKMTGEGLRTAPSAVDVLERAGVQDLPPAETGLPPGLAAAVAMSGEGTQRPGSGGSDSS